MEGKVLIYSLFISSKAKLLEQCYTLFVLFRLYSQLTTSESKLTLKRAKRNGERYLLPILQTSSDFIYCRLKRCKAEQRL